MDEENQSQTGPAENQEQTDHTALNPEQASAHEGASEATGAGSPPAQDDTASKLAALQAQLERINERNAYLEQSLRLQEQYQQRAGQTQQPATPKEEPWSSELDVLDKTLDPLFKRRLDSVVNPLRQGYTSLLEEADALRFENFLTRNHPEVFDDEDNFTRTMQQVEAIRQAAAQRGMQVSRVDAFVFNEGLNGVKQKSTARKQKKTTATAAEVKRQAEVQAAQGTSQTGAPRANAMAGIQAIRDKANRGERLTQDERAKLRDFVSTVEI